uniref:tripartite motif-containing protein 14-like n=1 Tax=Myxine glutinosa TaxID=7769 RepID=UPI00358F2880
MCPMCMDGQHEDHEVVAVEIAYTELKSILTAESLKVSKSRQHVQLQLDQLQQELKDTQHVGKGTKDRLEAKRRVLYQYVDEAVDILKSQVQTMEKRKIFLLEKQIEKVQQKMAYFTEPESSLQTALQELGVFSFLGVIRDVMKRIEFVSGFQSMKVTPSKVLDWSQEVNDLDSLMNDNKTFVERRTERPTEHPEMDEFEWNSYRSLYVRCPSLDPNSANRWIKISEQLKRATRASPKFQYSQSACDNRNDYCVLSSESFSSGRHYWEVYVGSIRHCRIGICLNSMEEKKAGGEFGLGGNPKSWCISKDCDSYSARHNNRRTSLSLRGEPKWFGFFLDCEEGELRCFADSQIGRHMYEIQKYRSDWRLLHMFKGNFRKPVKPALVIQDSGFVQFWS